MLVHRRARRSGVGRALFAAVEEEARRRGKTPAHFHTMTGGDAADRPDPSECVQKLWRFLAAKY